MRPSDYNPLREIVSSDIYTLLTEHNLLNEKGVRDYRIRQIGWFLPSHYLIVSFPRKSAMSNHFARL